MKEINLEELKNFYIDQQKSKVWIAEYFGVTVHTINKRVKEFELVRPLGTIYDITGKKFHNLTALKYIKNDKFGKAMWECLCDCGNIKVINSSSLIAGLTHSCGCYKRVSLSKGYKELSGSWWHKLEKSATIRNYEFAIDIKYMWELLEKQNFKCSLSGVDIKVFSNNDCCKKQTASIDRINPQFGYLKENVQWVHKRVNRLKNNLSNDEMIFWCAKINEHHPVSQKIFDINKIAWENENDEVKRTLNGNKDKRGIT